MKKEEFKVLLGEHPKKIKLDNLTTNNIHRLCILVDKIEFETFFMPSEHKKLYVIFSSIGRDKREYPIFHRVTWYNFFDGMFLWIDDPTRNQTQIAPTYYFGTKENNYLDYVSNIIDKFLELYNLTYNDLTFISSSNGGFAALWCAQKMHGATCLAFNPQLNIPLYYQTVKKFEEKLNISFEDETLYNRLYLYGIDKEEKSKICIFSNIRSESDKLQMDEFFKNIGISYKIGLQKVNNIWLIIANIDADNTHLAQPSPYISRMFEQIMSEEWGGMEISNKKIEIVNALLGCMREYYSAVKEIKNLKNEIDLLNNGTIK